MVIITKITKPTKGGNCPTVIYFYSTKSGKNSIGTHY